MSEVGGWVGGWVSLKPRVCYGYCATSQGSLDWFEVDLSARPASCGCVGAWVRV